MKNIIRLLPRLVEAAGDNSALLESAVKIAWSRAAGDGLRVNAAPLRFYDHKLSVAVADAVWQTQLKAMSPELLARVNGLLGRNVIKSFEFRVDPKSLDTARLQNDRANLSSGERGAGSVPIEVWTAAAAISDETLRERFLAAAGSVIARRESKSVERPS